MKRVFALSVMLLALLAFAPLAQAQKGKVYRIGFLAYGSPPSDPISRTFPFVAFRKALRKLGYVGGQNLIIEERWAAGKTERLSILAGELVQLKVDIIVASGASAVQAAMKATTTIPIVMAGAPDPVAFELVASLAHPGGNVTGLSDSVGRELEGKRLELLKESFSGISRVAVILDSASLVDISPLQDAAKALSLALIFSPETATLEEFNSTFALFRREGVQALYAPETPINARHRGLIVKLAAKSRLPAMYGSREFVEAGGLMSYGPSFSDLYRRAAFYVDRILKGIKPADLPVEQPEKFELIINLKTAKQHQYKISAEVLMRADEVIR